MVDHQLLRAVKDELTELKRQNHLMQVENDHLWGVVEALNKLQCGLQGYYSTADLLDLMRGILQLLLDAVRSKNGSIMLLDEEKDQLVFITVIGERQEELTDYRIPADAGIAGWVKTHQKSTLVVDVRKDYRWLPAVDQSVGFHTCCLMAAPLQLGGRLIGVMEVVNSLVEDHFNEKDLALFELIARICSFVIGCTEEALRDSRALLGLKNLN